MIISLKLTDIRLMTLIQSEILESSGRELSLMKPVPPMKAASPAVAFSRNVSWSFVSSVSAYRGIVGSSSTLVDGGRGSVSPGV